MSLLVARSTYAPWTRLVVPACAWLGAWAVWAGLAGISSPRRPIGGSAAMAFVAVWPLLAVSLPGRAPWIGFAALGACALGVPGAVAASWSSFAVAFVSLTMLGALSLGPLLPLAWGWTRTPVARCVAHECALLTAYGVFAATVNREGVTATDRALGPVVAVTTVLVAGAGLAWDLAARAQMRRVLAGRVAGWKVDAPETQRLPWLTWLGDVEGDARRTLVRVLEVGAAYRSGPAQEIAVARVPRAVSRVGASTVACGVLLLAALWRAATW